MSLARLNFFGDLLLVRLRISYSRFSEQLRECADDHVRIVHAQALASHTGEFPQFPPKLTNRLLDRLFDLWIPAQRDERLESGNEPSPDRSTRPW